MNQSKQNPLKKILSILRHIFCVRFRRFFISNSLRKYTCESNSIKYVIVKPFWPDEVRLFEKACIMGGFEISITPTIISIIRV